MKSAAQFFCSLGNWIAPFFNKASMIKKGNILLIALLPCLVLGSIFYNSAKPIYAQADEPGVPGTTPVPNTMDGSNADGLWISEFGYIAGGWRVDRHPRVMGDVNGDGKDDVVGFGDNSVYVALSTGTSFMPVVAAYNEFGYVAGGWRVERHPRMVADVNGDGKADLVGFGDAGVYVALSTSSGTTVSFAPMQKWISEFGSIAGGWLVNRHPRMLADVNGDGKADIVGFGDMGVYVALSTGSSFGPITKWISEFGYIAGGWQTDMHPRFMGDLNHDGKADVIGMGNNGTYVSLSTGSSFGPVNLWISEFGYIAGGWRVDQHPRGYSVDKKYCGSVIGFGNAGVYMADSNCSKGFYPIYQVGAGFGSSPAAGGWSVNYHPRMSADVNGDGIGDVVGFGNMGVYVGLLSYASPQTNMTDQQSKLMIK